MWFLHKISIFESRMYFTITHSHSPLGVFKSFLVGAVQVFKSRVYGMDFLPSTRVLGTSFSLKFLSLELKFSQNCGKLNLEMPNFSKNMSTLELKKGLKWWVSRVAKVAWKRGPWGWHIPTPSNVSAPLDLLKFCL